MRPLCSGSDPFRRKLIPEQGLLRPSENSESSGLNVVAFRTIEELALSQDAKYMTLASNLQTKNILQFFLRFARGSICISISSHIHMCKYIIQIHIYEEIVMVPCNHHRDAEGPHATTLREFLQNHPQEIKIYRTQTRTIFNHIHRQTSTRSFRIHADQRKLINLNFVVSRMMQAYRVLACWRSCFCFCACRCTVIFIFALDNNVG